MVFWKVKKKVKEILDSFKPSTSFSGIQARYLLWTSMEKSGLSSVQINFFHLFPDINFKESFKKDPPMADSCWWLTETNKILLNIYPSIKNKLIFLKNLKSKIKWFATKLRITSSSLYNKISAKSRTGFFLGHKKTEGSHTREV